MNEQDFLAFARSAALRLQNQEISVEQFHDLFRNLTARHDLRALYGDRYPELKENHGCLELYKEKIRGGKKRSIKLQLFAMKKFETHTPHGHVDISSFHFIQRGSLYQRRFRVGGHFLQGRERRTNGEYSFRKVFEGRSEAGEAAYIGEQDAHWFTALEDDTILLHFNVAGHLPEPENSAEDPAALSESRFYVDPSGADADGNFCSAEISRAESLEKFATQNLCLPPS